MAITRIKADTALSGTIPSSNISNTSLNSVTQLPFSAGTDWQSTIVTGTTLNAVAGKGYWIDTTSNACTITLPASASVGDFIEFSDYARTWGTNAITINQNSLNFQGYSSPNPVYNTSGQSVKLIYSGATKGWIPTVDDDVTWETPQTYTADFLVVAGGGGGGHDEAGGGGAGGYRNSYSTETSGGGGSSETSLTLDQGIVYTITVGAGGAGGTGSSPGLVGTNGVNSSISGTGITTITSIGGGYGASVSTAANSGGSGGGGSASTIPRAKGFGTANQGYDGGEPGASSASGGGGGGAGAVGANGSASSGNIGIGGAGLSSSITGSSVARGGGGGGSSGNSSTITDGGIGGGGNGASNNTPGTAGTVNTGGGGGSGNGYGVGNISAAGGSGVVILRMPDANYSGTTTGSPTVNTNVGGSGETVLIFNASGSYTG